MFNVYKTFLSRFLAILLFVASLVFSSASFADWQNGTQPSNCDYSFVLSFCSANYSTYPYRVSALSSPGCESYDNVRYQCQRYVSEFEGDGPCNGMAGYDSWDQPLHQCVNDSGCTYDQLTYMGSCADQLDCGNGTTVTHISGSVDSNMCMGTSGSECPSGQVFLLPDEVCITPDGQSSSSSSSASSSSSSSQSSQNSQGSQSSDFQSSLANSSSGQNSSSGDQQAFDDSEIVSQLESLNEKTQSIDDALNGDAPQLTQGSYDYSIPQTKVQEKTAEYNQLISDIQTEAQSMFNLNFSGAGTLTDNVVTTKWGDISFGWSRFAPQLNVIGLVVMFFAWTAAAIIILRR